MTLKLSQSSNVIAGDKCDRCAKNFTYPFPNCTGINQFKYSTFSIWYNSLTNDDFADCGCNPDTSVQCNENGTCQCKTNFGGQKCNNCSDISFGEFPNCIGKIVKNL